MIAPDIRLLDLSDGTERGCPLDTKNSPHFSIALGNFDGVHAAHRKLIRLAVDMAQRLCTQGIQTEPAAFFFRSPSGDYITPGQSGHLTTLEEKLSLFRSCGLRYVLMADFPSLKNWSAESFITEILSTVCSAKAVCCGYNFRFGKDGAGKPELLKQAFAENCTVLGCQVIHDEDGRSITISSSAIRQLLQSGETLLAASMLQYPYVVSGSVAHGKKLGRKLGFPTANLSFANEKLLPLCGVYASIVQIEGSTYFGVSNVGKRPTVDAPTSAVNCETHILDYQGDLYGKEIRVFLLYFLRSETAFPNLDALQAAISQNILEAKEVLKTPQSVKLIANINEYFKKD